MLNERATRSVVVASDEPMIINQICGILLNQNYAVVIEKSAIKGIARLLEQDHDFMILDIAGPREYFIDLIGIIRKMRPRLPIVVLSDDNSLLTLKTLNEAGAFYCMLKPVNQLEIENIVQAVARFHDK